MDSLVREGLGSKIWHRCVSKLKKHLSVFYVSRKSRYYNRAGEFLQRAQNLFEQGYFEESDVNCYKAMEGILYGRFGIPMGTPMWKLINRCKEDAKCAEFAGYLQIIGDRWKSHGAYYNEERETEEYASLILEMATHVFQEITGRMVPDKYRTFEKY